jgi:hypothetical protein
VHIQRTHIVIPQKLVQAIDKLVGKRGRSQFLTLAAEKELRRQRLLSALDRATGAWKDQDHPELKKGAAFHIAQMRWQADKRLKS